MSLYFFNLSSSTLSDLVLFRKKGGRQAQGIYTCNAPSPANILHLLSTAEAPRSGAENLDTIYRRPANQLNPQGRRQAQGVYTRNAPCAADILHLLSTAEAPRSGADNLDTIYRPPANQLNPQKKSRRQAQTASTRISSGPTVAVHLLSAAEAPRSGAHNVEAMYRRPASGVKCSKKTAGRRHVRHVRRPTIFNIVVPVSWRCRAAALTSPTRRIDVPRAGTMLRKTPLALQTRCVLTWNSALCARPVHANNFNAVVSRSQPRIRFSTLGEAPSMYIHHATIFAAARIKISVSALSPSPMSSSPLPYQHPNGLNLCSSRALKRRTRIRATAAPIFVAVKVHQMQVEHPTILQFKPGLQWFNSSSPRSDLRGPAVSASRVTIDIPR
ncbi:hypothetical protein DFH06DRAFT_1475552 [Mycena polygramma]|nr:hypothetical protein DFH06DRAFT_1475552 [Mycena polygramma]